MRLLSRLLRSRRYAIGAVAVLALIFGLAALVPDHEALGRLRTRRPELAAALERLQAAEVARSPVLLLITGYVGLAVAISLFDRTRAWRGRAWAGGSPALERFVAHRRVEVAGASPAVAEQVRRAARANGLPLDRSGLGGASGTIGFAGSMIFHLGLIVGLAGISLSALGRYSGEMVLVEGFPLPAVPETFLRADPPTGMAALRGLTFAASEVHAEYVGEVQLTGVSAVVESGRPGGPATRTLVQVNQTMEVEGFQFSVHAFGYAPELAVVGADGRLQAEGHAAVRVLPPGTEDSLDLVDGGRLLLRLYPDHLLVEGRDASRSLRPLAPVLAFTWEERGRPVAEGRVRLGESVEVAGRRVEFRSLARWIDLLVTRDPGAPWFALGAVLASLGLALRLGRPDRAWTAQLEPCDGGTRVELTVSARYFPALVEQQADRLVERLAEG